MNITSVSLRNFRGFRKLERLRMTPLTFLVGPNNSGKSSIADAILFMVQSGFLALDATKPLWSGKLVDLGSFRDTVYRHEGKRTLEIRVQLDGVEVPAPMMQPRQRRESMSLEVYAEVAVSNLAPEGRLKKLGLIHSATRDVVEIQRRKGRYESFATTAGKKKGTFETRQPWGSPRSSLASLLLAGKRRAVPAILGALVSGAPGAADLVAVAESVQRVSSGRDRPERSYRRTGGTTSDVPRGLIDGIDPAALEGEHRAARTLRQSIARGLTRLGIATDIDPERMGDHATELKLKDSVTRIASNLADFGYGASQVIPVLEGCANPGPGPLFVEQPEVHLHPRAQGELAQLICAVSAKRQVIVETHSEHMINRARLLVAKGELDAKSVIIHFVSRTKVGSRASEISLDDQGNFSRDWPEGFFDERYRDTMQLAKAQAKRAVR